MIHVSEMDRITEADRPIIEVPDEAFDEGTKSIASIIVDQIPDGATIQTGVGGLSKAIDYGLRSKCDLVYIPKCFQIFFIAHYLRLQSWDTRVKIENHFIVGTIPR